MRTGTEVPRVQCVVAVRDEEARAAIPAARVGEAGKGPPTGVPGGARCSAATRGLGYSS